MTNTNKKHTLKRHLWGIVALILWGISFFTPNYYGLLLALALIAGAIWIIASVRAGKETKE